MFYPQQDHAFGGVLLSYLRPESDTLTMVQNLEIDKKELAEDFRQNAAIRRSLEERAKPDGGLLASISETCERLKAPLGAIVLWQRDTSSSETEYDYASFHSVAVLSPDFALRAV